MAFTVLDLIFEAGVMAGIYDPADGTPDPVEANYGWRKLADLVDLLATNRLTMFLSARVGPFAVTAGQGDATVPAPITIGDGATWDTPRPLWIDYAGVIYTAGGVRRPELRMNVFTTREWKSVVMKGITATLSRSLFYQREFGASGFGNIFLYPVPSASFEVVLYVPVAVSEFPVDSSGNPIFTTVVSLPPGYRSMLISNLAKILCLGLTPITDDLRDEATRTLGQVKTSNVVTHFDALVCDAAVRPYDGRSQGWDWITGEIN